jgi:nucleoside 2-deoxyribosyltransferase
MKGEFEGQIRLDIGGWQRVDELRRTRVISDQAFVAMWFDPQMRDAWTDGIKPALSATGYTPIRLDFVEHNERIDDRIIAEIRRSGLVVADFTGDRGGVYFEAGFAMGLGIPVIWTCHKDDVEKLHFDTRQYNHIEWLEPGDLREKLELRIRATIPNHPNVRNHA